MDAAETDDRHDEPTQYVVARLQEAFAQDERVADPHIEVTVVDRDIFLTGMVATPTRREALDLIAARVCPRHNIHNEVTVADVSDPPATEDLA